MLVFNPDKRMSAKNLLFNPIFDEIRNTTQEVDAEHVISIPFDGDGMYDYDKFEDKIPLEQLKAAIEIEIREIRTMSPFRNA